MASINSFINFDNCLACVVPAASQAFAKSSTSVLLSLYDLLISPAFFCHLSCGVPLHKVFHSSVIL
nr:MAG TPA: hypothetical protein [Caudoviricetes sp.]